MCVRSPTFLGKANTQQIFDSMPKSEHPIKHELLLAQFKEHNPDLADTPGWMFNGLVVYFVKKKKTIDQLDGDTGPENENGYDLDTKLAGHLVHFAGGRLADNLDDTEITHVVAGRDENRLREIRGRYSLSVSHLIQSIQV